MPGAVTGAVDAPLEVFGGLITQFAPSDLPLGASPDCQDVEFSPGRVFTRAGLQSMFAAIAGNPTVNYLKTYITSNELLRTLVLDATGTLWKEDASASPGVLASIATNLLANCYAKSTTLFGREYIAFNDGANGRDIPRQFDDTNFDRVSCCGPGAAPTASDEVISNTIKASPTGILTPAQLYSFTIGTISESGNVATLTPTAGDFLHTHVGDSITITGTVNFNGTWVVSQLIYSGGIFSNPTSLQFDMSVSGLATEHAGTLVTNVYEIDLSTSNVIPANTTLMKISGAGDASYNGTWSYRGANFTGQLLYIPTGSGSASGNGTLTTAGNIAPGAHEVTVMFLTRQGYLTAPAPPFTWTSVGSARVILNNIPIGPSYVIARVIAFTLAGGKSFYYLNGGVSTIPGSDMVVHDNTTTSVTIDFNDGVLAAGTNVDNQFSLIYLGETAACVAYNDRLFTWGGINKVNNMVNLSFDGGFGTDSGGATFPLGWVEGGASYAGGAQDVTNPFIGGTYQITGDGATATRGLITQNAYQDFRNVPIIQPNTAYSVSLRVSNQSPIGNNFGAGVLHVEFFSPTLGGILAGGFALTLSTVTRNAAIFGRFTGGVLNALATVPSDIVLRVYVNGTPPNGSIVAIDEIEIYPTLQSFQSATVLASYAEQAESFDGVNGVMQISPYDGQGVRAAFELRGNLYFAKERSLYFTKDDATNEPALWTVERVSNKVGTPSIHGVAYGEDWVVIAARDGAYLFYGPEPEKISQEIQPTWDRINWAAGETIWTEVDIQKKRVLIGVPLDGATTPNHVLVLDYSYLDSAQEIIEFTSIHSSTYTGKNIDIDKARKWAIWTIAANSGALVERNNGTAQTWVGNGAGTGKVYQIGLAPALGGTQTSDDGAAINSYYNTFFFLEHQLEQQFQLGSHRKLFIYLNMFVEGSGNLTLQYFPNTLSASQPLPTVALANPALRDTELCINAIADRVSFKIGTNVAGQWFSLQKFVPTLKRHDWADVRGTTT